MRGSSRRQRTRRSRSAIPSRNGSRGGIRSRLATARNLAGGRTARRRGSKGIPALDPAERQRSDARYLAAVRNFEGAVRFFQRQNYERAKEIFDKLLRSAPCEMAERVRVYLRVCEQKLGRPAPAPKTASDYYNLGVAELNARNLDSAIKHLSKAHKLEPNQELVRYALAAAHALQGNADAALEHLKAAIALRPENRFQARHDEDFRSLAADPRFKSLVYSAISPTSRITS